ncbi:hypothetical protein ACS0TY_004215 [Phlomoides rotata]
MSTSSRKKPCLDWGEGLAKYEKKKVVGLEAISERDNDDTGVHLEDTGLQPFSFERSRCPMMWQGLRKRWKSSKSASLIFPREGCQQGPAK